MISSLRRGFVDIESIFKKLYLLTTFKSPLSSQSPVEADASPFPGHLTPCAQMQKPESGVLEQPLVRLNSPFSALRPGG